MLKYNKEGVNMGEPLAVKLRPLTTKEVIGQSHLLGKDKVLSNTFLKRLLLYINLHFLNKFIQIITFYFFC